MDKSDSAKIDSQNILKHIEDRGEKTNNSIKKNREENLVEVNIF